jgi:hypothetical protein
MSEDCLSAVFIIGSSSEMHDVVSPSILDEVQMHGCF